MSALGFVLQVSANPDPKGLPGHDKLQGLVNGLYSWSLILVLAALVVAAVTWAWGSHANHHGAATAGRRGVVLGFGAALLVGMAPQLVNFFYGLGRQ
ncbi:MAG: DUF6112 family protein [Thermoleophilia bacterium]